MRKFLIVANWKMNGDTMSNTSLFESFASCAKRCESVDLVVCPTFVHIRQAVEELGQTQISVGAQTVSEHAPGACTGDVSVDMLREAGCKYVIVGHSERRQSHGETDELVAAKFSAAQRGGLIPIVCIGENLEQRQAGKEEAVVSDQLNAVFGDFDKEKGGPFVVAYEPVWAIGAKEAATPEQVDAMHRIIHSKLSLLCGEAGASRAPIIYGGSVDQENAHQLFSLECVNGGLIGRASLKAQSFEFICNSAQSVAAANEQDMK